MGLRDRPNRGIWERLGRLSRLKLLIPLKRSPHSAEYSARGVGVGMFWALTPLVGVQMPLCLLTWLILKPFQQFQFSLVISFAWTWVSNVFTMLPMYYFFYVSGRIMMGSWDDITGYDTFLSTWDAAFTGNGFWQGVLELLALLAAELGIAMAVGCLPYAIIGGWVSYHLSLKYVRRRRQKRLAKRTRKAIDEGKAVGTHAPSGSASS